MAGQRVDIYERDASTGDAFRGVRGVGVVFRVVVVSVRMPGEEKEVGRIGTGRNRRSPWQEEDPTERTPFL